MMLKSFLKKYPEIKEFWLQSKDRQGAPDSFCLCRSDNFDDMNHFGNFKIKSIVEPPEKGEAITLFI